MDDLERCYKKKWYRTLYKEMPRICRFLKKEGKMQGESPFHYINSSYLQGRTFHGGINLPGENVGKRQGGRMVYVKEDSDLIKAIYVGGHKDKRYPDSIVNLIENRYNSDNFEEYTEEFDFSSFK